MYYYHNYSLGACLYFSMHGSYGLIWLLKHFAFPDAGFNRKVTFLSFVYPWFVALIPYWYSGYLMMSGQAEQDPCLCKVILCLWLYIVGVVLVTVSDAQKYFVLKERKGLISDGLFKYTRNPNYLGEIMLYSSFAIMVNNRIVWIIMAYMWGIVFTLRIYAKELSLRKKDGWKKYSH